MCVIVYLIIFAKANRFIIGNNVIETRIQLVITMTKECFIYCIILQLIDFF